MADLAKSYSKASKGLIRLSVELGAVLRIEETQRKAAIESALEKVDMAKAQMAMATTAARSTGITSQGRQLTLLEAAAYGDPSISNPAKMHLHARFSTAADHIANIVVPDRLGTKVTLLSRRIQKLAEQLNSQIPRTDDIKSLDPQAYILSDGRESESWIGFSTKARAQPMQIHQQGSRETDYSRATAQRAVQKQPELTFASNILPILRETGFTMQENSAKASVGDNAKRKDLQGAIATRKASGKEKKHKKCSASYTCHITDKSDKHGKYGYYNKYCKHT